MLQETVILVKLGKSIYIRPDAIISARTTERGGVKIGLVTGEIINLDYNDPAAAEAIELLDSLSLPTTAELSEDLPLNGHSLN